MRVLRVSIVMLTLALPGTIAAAQTSRNQGNSANPDRTKPRIVITTDPELDDSNSLVRRFASQERSPIPTVTQSP